MIQCAYCADLHVVWTFWWFWQLIFLFFFIQFNSEVKVKGHGGIFRYQRLEYGVLYICTKFQPHITTNMEVVLKFSLTTLSLQKSAKNYRKVQKKMWFFFHVKTQCSIHTFRKKQPGIINVTVFITKNWFCKNQSSRVKKIIDIVKVKGRNQLFSSSSVRYNKSTFPNQISSKLDEFYGSYGHFRLSLQKNVQKNESFAKKFGHPSFS